MDTEDVSKLFQTDSIDKSDLFHVLRNNEYSMFLSYKEKINRFTDIYQDVSIINTLTIEIKNLLNQLNTLSASMLTRELANSTYATIEMFEAKKEQLLTKSNMESLMEKYVRENDALSKKGELISEANKLADEITDFGGAAMIGINQSNATFQAAPSAITD